METQVRAPLKRDFLFKRIIKGDVGLIKIFWLGYILGLYAGSIYLGFFTSIPAQAVYVAYMAMITVGVWRSANKYKGLPAFKYSVKIFIILEVLIVVAGLIYLTVQSL